MELDDEKILEALGVINLGKSKGQGLIKELESKIEKETQEYKEVGNRLFNIRASQ